MTLNVYCVLCTVYCGCTVQFKLCTLYVYVSIRFVPSKYVMQRKLFQKCTHFLYCSVVSLGSNVNTRRMLPPDVGSIFHIKNQWNILVVGNYMWIIKIIKFNFFYPPRILKEHWCIFSCLQIPPRKNWFQYVRRV